VVYRVDAYPPYGGYGIGSLLVDAAVFTALPVDGYTWHTTAQYDDARGFWKTMARLWRTPFTNADTGCPHMP
jgi:hypothetical protein